MFDKKEKAPKLSKEEKTAANVQKLMEDYNLLDISDPRDIESLRKVCKTIDHNTIVSLGSIIAGESENTILWRQIYNQEALMEQNFVIIRYLDKIYKELSK